MRAEMPDMKFGEQLLVIPSEPLGNWEWLPGECLSGSEYSKAWHMQHKHASAVEKET